MYISLIANLQVNGFTKNEEIENNAVIYYVYYRVSQYKPAESISFLLVVRIGLKLYKWLYFGANQGTFMFSDLKLTRVNHFIEFVRLENYICSKIKIFKHHFIV